MATKILLGFWFFGGHDTAFDQALPVFPGLKRRGDGLEIALISDLRDDDGAGASS